MYFISINTKSSIGISGKMDKFVKKRGKKNARRKLAAVDWRILRDEGFTYLKGKDYTMALLQYDNQKIVSRVGVILLIMGLDAGKAAKDILSCTAEDEVLQSYVRGDSNSSRVRRRRSIFQCSNAKMTESGDAKVQKASAQGYRQPAMIGGCFEHAGKRLMEEAYTDKDRAAAVNLMGTKDIKASLKLKRQQDRSNKFADIAGEEAHPGTAMLLAKRELAGGNVEMAVKFVNKALELNPYDKNALVARSRCHLLLGEAQLALEDAESALKDDANFFKGLYEKAEALYHLGEFEHSLVFFHKGLRLRPSMECLKCGVHKAQQAIRNAVGKSVPAFKHLMAKSNEKASTDDGVALAPFKAKSFRNGSRDPLPGELKADKIYLEKLLNNPDIECCVGGKNDIKAEVEDGVKFLEMRREFWKQQLPQKQTKCKRPQKH